ncbi:MAG TPA: sulfatase-like hydrolase/transferase [Pirellulaceae bacterium]|nr:sulfatase-like hydrolase/transferase [Pirellulaceae bacterium]
MSHASAIVLVVDRLGAGHLGPYGNTWLDTPHFNRLAARSLVCETVLADSPDLAAAYRGWWTGRHVLEAEVASSVPLPARAAASGAATLLVTDDPAVADDPLAAGFAKRVIVETRTPARTCAEVEQTGLFRLFASAIESIERSQTPMLAWIHARGMAGPWDAPRAYRERLADPEDPPPPDLIAPPERRLDRHVDPDEVLGLVQAYGGQVQLVDECLGLLLEALERLPRADETLFAVTSPRGYPLGEHGRVGPCDEALYSELLQVPLMIQFPRGEGRLQRTQHIVQPADLFATLADACGFGELAADERDASLLAHIRGDSRRVRNLACATGPNQRAIRTAAWYLREIREHAEPRYELFAKPDDRWEANEVSSRCEEVAALLAAELDRFEQAARAGELAKLASSAEILQDIWR